MSRPKADRPSSDDAWLSLGPASRLVGVDPDTMRRWADEGRVEVYHTPGGHRRFARRSLRRLILEGSRGRSTMSSLGATPEKLTDAYRREYLARDGLSPNPLEAVSEEEREVFRRQGRDLVSALVHHLGTDGTDALAEATELSSWLGARLASSGTSLTESVALFVAARRPFMAEMGTLAKRRRLDSREVATLFDSASDALDRCLLAFIDGHRGDAAPDRAR